MTSSDEDRMYLSDSPISSEEEDRFGHTEYVDTLSEMIQNAEPPWHIGIFGEWGSGKSSIINLLYNRIRRNPEFEGILCIEFDAWAHAEDSIRTELLLEIDQRIGEEINQDDGVLGEDEITGRLYDVEEEEQIDPPDGPWEILQSFWNEHPLLSIGFLVIAGIAIASEFLGYPTIASIAVTGLLLPVLGYILQELDTVARTIQRKFLYPRKEWTGAYQRIFESIIEESDADKIVISIDNLDRCESDTVYDVLVSLKTFLENDNCIYLIPCDDEALESHLKAISKGGYFGENRSEREFLRKFFQTHIRIPPFLPEDVEKFAQEQNKKLGDEFNQETIDVVINAYFENPRRIKHAINRLVTLRSIAREREAEEILRPGRFTNNMPFLAKISVLEEEYPHFHQELVDDPYLLDDINSYFNSKLSDDDKRRWVQQLLDTTDRRESQLEAFLRSTRRITVDNVRPFLNLSEPSYSTTLDDVEEFLNKLKAGGGDLQNDVEAIYDRGDSFDRYLDAISDTLEGYYSSGRSQPIFSIIDGLTVAFDAIEESEQRKAANIVGHYLRTDMGKEFLDDVDASAVFPIIIEMSNYHSRPLFEEFADRVNGDSGFQKHILMAFTNHAEEVPEGVVRDLSDSITRLSDDSLQSALQLIADSGKSKEHLATPDIIEESVSLVEVDDGRNEYIHTGSYGRFDDIASPEERSRFIVKLLDLRDSYQGNQEPQMNSSLAHDLQTIEPDITETTAHRLVETLRELTSTGNNENPEIVEAAVHFYSSFSEETSSEFHEWIAQLFRQWNPNNARKIFELCVKKGIPVLRTEEEIEVFLKLIPSQINEEDFIVGEVIPMIPPGYNSKVVDKTIGLIGNNNTNLKRLGLRILEEHPERLEDSFGSVIDRCGREAQRNSNINIKRECLTPIANRFQELEGPEQENFIGQMENLLSGNGSHYELYQELWEKIEEHADSDRRAAIVGDVHQEVTQQIERGQNSNNLTPLIEVLQSMPDELDENEGQRFMERLSDQLSDRNLNANQSATIIEQIAGFEEFYGKEEQILDRVENLLQRTNNNNVVSSSEELIEQFDKMNLGESDRVEEIRETHLET